jgi:hypothetical protein
MANQTHVVPNPKGGWDVKQDDAERASRHFETKQDAVEFGRDLSKRQGTELVIHNKSEGEISQKDSHGSDKNPPKG